MEQPASQRATYDAVIVGAGPNGLAAAIELSRANLSTLVLEARETPGGGARSHELTLPGFTHDLCSTVHPLGAASPFFRSLGLERHGLSWIDSPLLAAHVLNDGTAVVLERSIEETARRLGTDAAAYRELFAPFVDRADELNAMILGPLRVPSSPLLLSQFGLKALRSLRGLTRARFNDHQAPALLAGIAAHAMLPLNAAATASFALVLGIAGHAAGWPIARGGSAAITNALLACLTELGGEVVTNYSVQRFDQLPPARAYLFDVSPQQLLQIAGDQLPAGYRSRLRRFRHAPGVFKMDWALSGPIPWIDPSCARAATVHLSGSLDQVSESEAAVHAGRVSDRPFVLVVQASLFDPSRVPAGRQSAWAYCHVPHGSSVDAASLIEAQIERAAPGFRDLVLARSVRNAIDMQHYNANFVGGDISGGLPSLAQLFFRPVARVDPYSTPAPHIFLCSASTPPGGGVHGMCGYWAARSALRRRFGIAPDGSVPQSGRV
jgi:phytoene dehydrogenase-like protein